MGRMENHCIALLGWASKDGSKGPQTLEGIEDACGIPMGSLKALLSFHRHHGSRTCYLCATARNFRYWFKVLPEGSSRIIDCVHLGYTPEAFAELEQGDNCEETHSFDPDGYK